MAQIDDRIKACEERLKHLKAQKQLAENREKKKVQEQNRKDDTRRKILIGSMYLQKMKNDEQFNQQILNAMNSYLTEDRDRKLFELPVFELTPNNGENQ